MGLFQSDNYWKKKARSAKLQSAPLDPEAAWRKAVTSSTLWLVGGIALIAFYLSGARAGVVTIDSGVMILLVLIGCYCLYLGLRRWANCGSRNRAPKEKRSKPVCGRMKLHRVHRA